MADWKDENQIKFGIEIKPNKISCGSWSVLNGLVFGLTVQSKEHAEILLEEFKERIERWY